MIFGSAAFVHESTAVSLEAEFQAFANAIRFKLKELGKIILVIVAVLKALGAVCKNRALYTSLVHLLPIHLW